MNILQTIVKVILYTGAGLVLFAILFAAVALIPGLNVEQTDAAKVGAAIGALVGLAYGATRKFQ